MKSIMDSMFKEIWGESPLTFYFSSKGTFNRLQYWGALVTINFFATSITSLNIFLLWILAYLMAFFATWTAIKKRCRDIQINSKFFLLIYSVFFPGFVGYKYMKNYALETSEIIKNLCVIFACIYMLELFFLLFFPGKKKNAE